MSEDLLYGHSHIPLKEVARTLTLSMIYETTVPFVGALYMVQRDWDSIYNIFQANRGSWEQEFTAVHDALRRCLDPADMWSHLFAERMFCAGCKESPCDAHKAETYQMPGKQSQLQGDA